MTKLTIIFLAAAIILYSVTPETPDDGAGDDLMTRLATGEEVALTPDEFPEFDEVCLVGYDRFPSTYPEHVYDQCAPLKDHSLIGLREDGTCVEIISGSLWQRHLINFGMDGTLRCEPVSTSAYLKVLTGVEGLTRDRLELLRFH